MHVKTLVIPALAVAAVLMASALVTPYIQQAFAPRSGRGVPSVIIDGQEFMAWPEIEDGFITMADGKQFPNLDMVFARADVGEEPEDYINLLADPNRIAETAEITADESGITIRWWETDLSLSENDPLYTIPFRTTSTDDGQSWTEPQNISDLPDGEATFHDTGARRGR